MWGYYLLGAVVIILIVIAVAYSIHLAHTSTFILKNGDNIQIQDNNSRNWWGGTGTTGNVVLSSTPVTYVVEGASNNYFRLRAIQGNYIGTNQNVLIYQSVGNPIQVNLEAGVFGNTNQGILSFPDSIRISDNYVTISSSGLLVATASSANASVFTFNKVPLPQ